MRTDEYRGLHRFRLRDVSQSLWLHRRQKRHPQRCGHGILVTLAEVQAQLAFQRLVRFNPPQKFFRFMAQQGQLGCRIRAQQFHTGGQLER